MQEIMHPGIVSCGQTAAPAEIARIMTTCGVHCVAVIGFTQDDRKNPLIWGIVSDLDLLAAAVTDETPVTAGSLAKQAVISVRLTMSAHEAVEAMVRYGAHHVVVVDPDRRTPIGVISTLDAAALLAQDTD